MQDTPEFTVNPVVGFKLTPIYVRSDDRHTFGRLQGIAVAPPADVWKRLCAAKRLQLEQDDADGVVRSPSTFSYFMTRTGDPEGPLGSRPLFGEAGYLAGRLLDAKGHGRRAVVDWIAVCPDDRNLGYASQAIEKLEEALAQQERTFGSKLASLEVSLVESTLCLWWAAALCRRGFARKLTPGSGKSAMRLVKTLGD